MIQPQHVQLNCKCCATVSDSLHVTISVISPPITPLSLAVIFSSLIMNPTGVFFIRQAEQERPASPADPATLSSLGIWQRNFNRKAAQAGRSAEETLCMPI